MRIKNWTAMVLTTAMVGVGVGCAQNTPVSPTSDRETLPAPAAGDRQVLSTVEFPTFAEVQAQLPDRIPEAEADKLLVEIDPSQIQLSQGGYSVQATAVQTSPRTSRPIVKNLPASQIPEPEERVAGARTPSSQDFDRFDRDARTFTRDRFFPRSRSFRYYGLGGSYFPYYYSAGYYYPYRNIYSGYGAFNYLYSPFLYNYGGGYSPYTYASPFGWGGYGGVFGGMGYGGGWGPYGNQPGMAVQSATVTMQDVSFQPQTVTLRRGGSVRWQNQGLTVHTATSVNGGFDTGDVVPGQSSGTFTFSEPGVYQYICEYHPQMQGTIIVE